MILFLTEYSYVLVVAAVELLRSKMDQGWMGLDSRLVLPLDGVIFLLLETCLREQHWEWKIPQDAVTRAVQKFNAESFWINLPKISIKILGVSIIQVDSSDPSGPLINRVFSSKYDTNENSH